MGMTFVWAVELTLVRDHGQRHGPGRRHPDDHGPHRGSRNPARSGSGTQPRHWWPSWPRRPPPVSTGRSSAGPVSDTPSFRLRGRLPPCGRRVDGRRLQVAEHFHEVLGQRLQPVGMPAHPLSATRTRPWVTPVSTVALLPPEQLHAMAVSFGDRVAYQVVGGTSLTFDQWDAARQPGGPGPDRWRRGSG